jgi:transposase-like protein
MSILSAPYFHDEAAAIAKLESIVWPNGPVCPHCGGVERITVVGGKTARPGLKRCLQCKKQFTAKVGTVLESSHVPVRQWLQVAYLLASSKKGISSHQIHRFLGVQYNTALFMTHRLREAMRDGSFAPFGGNKGAVEVDETFIGHDKTIKPRGQKKGRGYAHKHKVLSLIDRNTGRAHSMVVDDLKAETIIPIIRANIHRESRIMTDEAGQYIHVRKHFVEHGVVRHGQEEYVHPDDKTIHTNTIEGFFSIFKRGMKGVYQHCGKQHLHRYLAEFDFRYNERVALGVNDVERTASAIRGIVGKRLMYRDSSAAERAS